MAQSAAQSNRTRTTTFSGLSIFAGVLVALSGCNFLPKSEAEAQQSRSNEGPAAVDVAIAQTVPLKQDIEYTGTTQPYRQVSVRSQVEGQLVDLNVDVGDPVRNGQTLGQLDAGVLTAAVVQAEAEVAARQAEVAQARTEVSNARTQVEDARLQLQQAQSDLARYEQLLREGAIPEQQVDVARTTAGTARQALRSAEEQVRTRQQAVAAVQRRVVAQQAIAAQNRERQSFSILTSPVTGFVMERPLEPGNLAQPGTEVVKLGDFSQVKVSLQVSEREFGNIQVGQPVQVRIDAFPNQQISGRVTRVSPAANPPLIPIEVTIPNVNGKIGSGLLARVSFTQQALPRVVIPETALETNQDRRSRQQGQNSASGRNGSGQQQNREGGTRSQPARKSGTVFVLNNSDDQPTVRARQVALGQRQDGRIEILSGLRPGDRFVVRSSKALQDGAPVRLSVISNS